MKIVINLLVFVIGICIALWGLLTPVLNSSTFFACLIGGGMVGASATALYGRIKDGKV